MFLILLVLLKFISCGLWLVFPRVLVSDSISVGGITGSLCVCIHQGYINRIRCILLSEGRKYLLYGFKNNQASNYIYFVITGVSQYWIFAFSITPFTRSFQALRKWIILLVLSTRTYLDDFFPFYWLSPVALKFKLALAGGSGVFRRQHIYNRVSYFWCDGPKDRFQVEPVIQSYWTDFDETCTILWRVFTTEWSKLFKRVWVHIIYILFNI